MSTLFFDDFQQEPVNKLDVPSLANWNILSGSVDVVGNGNLCSTVCLDMDGTNLPKGSLVLESKQSFNLDGWYELFFDLAGSQRDFRFDVGNLNTVTGAVGNNTLTVTLGSFDPFTTQTMRFYTQGVSKIRFESLESPDMVGLLLDNVGLRTYNQPVTAVPEPASLVLVGSMLLILLSKKVRNLIRI